MLWKYCTQYASKLGKLSSSNGLEKVSFFSSSKERQCQRMFKLPHNCTHVTHWQVTLKILQARLQQDVNRELPDVQAGFRKCRGNQRLNCQHLLDHRKSKRIPEKRRLLLHSYAKAFDCVDPRKLWKILRDENTRSSYYLSPERPVCRSRSNS